MRLQKNGRLDGGPVSGGCMLLKGVDARGDDCSLLRHTQKDLLGGGRRSIKPVRIVKGAAVKTDGTLEPLKRQIQLGSAILAEMHMNRLATAFRNMIVGLCLTCRHEEIVFTKNRLDQIGAACCPLAELAVANRQSCRL